MTKFIKAFFYGNIYLGVCAVVLCIETSLVIHVSLNIFPFYLLIFFCTVIYYTTIYVRSVKAKNYNDRTIWYRNNLTCIKEALTYSIGLTIAFLLFFVVKNLETIVQLSPLQLLLITAFPLAAGWYTFVPKFFGLKKIRQIGLIKPFIVGLTWAGWVTVYPVFISSAQKRQDIHPELLSLFLLWFQNFLFFSVNAIIFDIKDYRADTRHHLKTYPVVVGIKNTFYFIITPVLIVNFAVFILFQCQQNFTILQSCIQLIPYLLLVFVIARYRQGRRVLYYLAAVDGLVFLKAVCGITSIIFFKK